jgi:phosphatidylglycerophosphate synthase
LGDTPYQPTDRRPIASRDTRWANAVADWLAQRGVSANAISVAGMIAGLAAGAALAATAWLEGIEQHLAWLAGAALVQLRLLANLFDGMVAIASGQASRVGELYNDVPDRFSDMAGLIGLGYAAGGQPELGYLAAAVALLTAYIRVLGKSSGLASDYCGPMAKQQRMFVVTVCAVYLVLTPADWQPAWGLPKLALAIILVGGLVTTLRRLLRVAWQLRKAAA